MCVKETGRFLNERFDVCTRCFWASQVTLGVKNSPARAGRCERLGSDPCIRRSPAGGHGNPLQRSCLDNSHGQRNLVGNSPWGGEELDMTQHIVTTQKEVKRAREKASFIYTYTYIINNRTLLEL